MIKESFEKSKKKSREEEIIDKNGSVDDVEKKKIFSKMGGDVKEIASKAYEGAKKVYEGVKNIGADVKDFAVEEYDTYQKINEKNKALFESGENMSIFREMGDGAKNFVNKLYEGAKRTLTDRPRIIWNNAWFNHHQEKVTKFSSEIIENEKQIEAIKQRIFANDNSLKFLKEKGADIPYKDERKYNKEKIELEGLIGELQGRNRRTQIKLERRENKANIYNSRIGNIAEKVLGRIDEKLNPYERRLENLHGKKTALDAEIQTFKTDLGNKRFEGNQKLKDLKKEKKSAPISRRNSYNINIAEIKMELKKGERNILQSEKKRNKMLERMERIDNKARYWRDIHREFTKMRGKSIL